MEIFGRETWEACETPFFVRKIKDLKDKIEVLDPLSLEILLRGDWTSRIHRTGKDCRAHLEQNGPAYSWMDKDQEFYVVF